MSEVKDGSKMENNSKFDINSFASPDVAFAPVYVWVWNDVCTCDIIDEQLAEMNRLGIRAFYVLPEPKNFRPDSMPTRLSPEYLSPEFFELCAYAVEKAEKLGMRCWIYDEGGWPSGGACGRVLKDHPEFARQTVRTCERSFSAGEAYKKTSPDVLAAFIGDGTMIPEDHIFAADTAVTEYYSVKEICGDADYPDLLNKDATDYFIEITHEKYASAMKSGLGSTVTAVFTDEPKAPYAPFNKELADKYEAIYGESVLPYLPLISRRVKATEDNAHILHRWCDLCSRMFCESFLLPCKEWANRHGMAFTGHMDKDHDPLGCVNGGGSFNLMRALRCFDIPGIDVIWRQLYPESRTSVRDDMNAYNGFFPRYASSAAAQNGKKSAMTEIFGVAGAAVTYDTMRFTAGYQAVRGINIFNLFNFPLGRKDELLAQELPIFTESQPFYRYLKDFNGYLERLSYISSLGERVCETGLYYPVCDFQSGLNARNVSEEFDSLGRKLEETAVDFDIVDDDVIQSADTAESGCLRIGKAAYRRIVIPKNAFIPQKTRKALDRFVKGGGMISHCASDIPPVIRAEGTGLRAIHRKAENAELFILFRESGDSGEYRIHLPSPNGYLPDLSDGTLRSFKTENGILKLSLDIGETAVILLTDEALTSQIRKDFVNRTVIPDFFMLRRKTELVINENGFECTTHSDKPAPVILGGSSELIGGFSGSCDFETEFTLPYEKVGKEGELDLGEVHFAAEVTLNGQPLGAALMPPYRLKIPVGLLAETNGLKITVTNTSANAYIRTDYFSKKNIAELSPYFEAELNYAKDLVSDISFGPVTLFTE